MGLGVHGGGLGVACWLIRQGAQVTVTDMAPAERLATPLARLQQIAQEQGATVAYTLGEHRATDFASHDIVVANPAVRPDSPWLATARAAGATIETEMTLFFRHCPGPILGITGTKGKTTTTLLTGALLRQQHLDTVIAGNLRVSALDALDQITSATPVVLELSSFQLVGLGTVGLSPRYACVTNFSPDHLNYHDTMAEYGRAKQEIFRHQAPGGTVILNEALRTDDDPGDWFAVPSGSEVRTFGVAEGSADCRITRSGYIEFCGEYLCAVSDIQLSGPHNRENVLAAVALARSFGVTPAAIRQGVQGFRGVEHRLELVREIDGVSYINDTTATNPVAAEAALSSFNAPIILIAGGADKQLALDAFAQQIARRVKALVLLAGSATEYLEQAVRAASPSPAASIHGPHADFATAIGVAQQLAEPGDVVLLSPGCASFGMFQNEFHRGEEFRRIVTEELASRSVQPPHEGGNLPPRG